LKENFSLAPSKKKSEGKSAKKTKKSGGKPTEKQGNIKKKGVKKKPAPKKAPVKKRGNSPSAVPRDIVPAPPKKRKDLIQALTEYDEADVPGDAANEKIDPRAVERGDIPMTLVDHLGEIRSRIITSIIVVIVLTIGAFVYSNEILKFLTAPYTVTGYKLNVFKLTEGFMIRLKVSAIAALLVGVPFIIHQVWRFILPAIERKDRMFSRVSLLASILLFYSGVVFVFYLLVPFTVKVLLSFVAKDWISTIGANDYINLVFFFCVVMGILFELPIIMMILTRIGVITPSFLVRKRKYAIVFAFVISAVITPTQDMLTQLIVAIPLILLYEASIFVSKLTTVRKRKRELQG
jgi:sec-independent protein translocase protein TatC